MRNLTTTKNLKQKTSMKKIKLIFVALTVLVFTHSKTQAQNCVEKGTILIDAFYGYPYYNGTLLKALVNNSSSVRNLNHIGGKVEYMISDKIGLGVEATYADVSITYLDSNVQYKAGVSKIRALGKMSIHFATNEHVDPYFTFGAGVKHTTIYDNSPNGIKWNGNLIPLAIRAGIGFRYFFTDAIGISAEVGLGGPLAQAGLAFKL